MSDFVAFYPDEATLAVVAQGVAGLWVPPSIDFVTGGMIPGHVGAAGIGTGGAGWAVSDPVTYGAGLARLLRWLGDDADMPLPPGIAPVATPASVDDDGNQISPAVTTIAAGPVILTTAIPDDFPLRWA